MVSLLNCPLILAVGTAPATQGPLSSMQNMKNTLPNIHGSLSYEKTSQNIPLMVMPSGQTVPLSAFYGHNVLNNQTSGLPYMQNGLTSGFVANPAYMPPARMGQFQMNLNNPQATNTDYDTPHNGAWTANDENVPINNNANLPIKAEFYPITHQFTHPANTFGQYLPGPIQPMKTSDNKDYEMVNLDHIVQQDPPIPRAVPALWTNQEDMTLAKCLQNPEGITNVYLRGFMPDTTDEDLHRWASRFGEIESCKAIIDQDTGKCKGCVDEVPDTEYDC